ncbi:head GIN domain-containing protein [Flavobacterium sp.]
MKKFTLLFLLIFVFNSCEKPSDCIESSGTTVMKEIPVMAFSKVKVYRGIEVIITDGPIYKVEVEAGENFINDIEVTQSGDQLILKQQSSCNWVRDYGQTKIYITTPTLTEIYSKTDRNISSNGILTYPNLSILSLDKDADGESGAGTGDFHIHVENNSLSIYNNNVSRFYLSGTTNVASLNFYFGDGRIEAQNLVAQKIIIFHRGSNDMFVTAIQSIEGVLNSTGNLILSAIPTTVNVQELYHGRVVYP